MSDAPPKDPLWPQVGQSLGPWLILRHHDLEGSGDMFLAKRRDGAFEREVLITLQIPTAPGEKDDGVFIAERELQSRLDHPGIAKVLGAGLTQDGLPYLVTEFLDGINIEEHLDAIRASVAQRLGAYQQVCHAVQHAHEKGLCGLNLQASNVHLMPDGNLRIVVFGLALWNRGENDKRATRASGELSAGPVFAGEYASPEQWSSNKPDASSDVYSLGALLYRLLTGSSPHDLQGLTPAQARTRVQRGSVPRASVRAHALENQLHALRCSSTPRALVSSLSGDLDRILSKALARNPIHRYASALEFSEDLERHLAGQPIRARGPAPLYLLSRRLKRYRVPVTLFLSVVLVLGWALRRSISSSERANEALIEARALETNAEELGQRLRKLCVRFMTELGPSMQGRAGMEEARRYLLNVGAPLLDHLRGSGYEDIKLAMHICRSYSELAEADFVSRDVGNLSRTPESARKALSLSTSLLAQVPPEKRAQASHYYARALRSAIWFADLTLNEEGGRAIIDNIPKDLARAGLQESELPTVAQICLSEARRTFYSSQLNYDKALAAWNLEHLRTQAESEPDLLPFFEADYSRLASVRAADLIRAGRAQEALYELPTLVYQMSAEVDVHDPPVLSLLGNETDAWINLAKVRINEGMPPGEALTQASRHLSAIRNRFSREPGAQLILLGADWGMGLCKLEMGPERRAEALKHLDQAAGTLQNIVQRGSSWPAFRVRLARIHRLRAHTLFDLGNTESAHDVLQTALQLHAALPPSLADHSRVIVLGCELRIEQLHQQEAGLPHDISVLNSDLEILRQRGVGSPILKQIEHDIAQLQTRAGATDPVGALPK